MISIRTDVNSIKIQNNLTHITDRLNSAVKHLSTGEKITQAKDDAAGLYIISGLSTRIRALNVGVSSSQTATNILNIAEGSIDNMKNSLSRIRDLAVQAANDYYSADVRTAMQNEADALIEEIYREKESCNFNGKKLLDSLTPPLSQTGEGVSATNGGEVSNSSIPPLEGRLGEVSTNAATTQLTRDDFENIQSTTLCGVAFDCGKSKADGKTYYFIENADQLRALGEKTDSLNKNFVLFNDIDLQNQEFNPIGWDDSNMYTGTFDGNGHIILNLYINKPDTEGVGMFGNIYCATIKNTIIEDMNLVSNGNVGFIGIANNSDISNINIYLTNSQIKATAGSAGALAGRVQLSDKDHDSNVENCHVYMSNSSVESTGSTGGLIGSASGVSGATTREVAKYAYITDCSVSMDNSLVHGKEQVAGLIGNNWCSTYVSNCYVKLDNGAYIKGDGAMTGGIAGWTYFGQGKVENCYAEYTNDSYVTGQNMLVGYQVNSHQDMDAK